MNHELALSILKELARNGVKTICLCAGARNAPFVQILEKSVGFEVLPFFDERSAGFFALGRAKRDQQPVAVLTTSGTAVSELLSSAIEAFYSETPIVFVTADRPKRLRGSGAPQAIDQKDIFANYADPIHDFDSLVNINIEMNLNMATHINVCFDEPLLATNSQETFEFNIRKVAPLSSKLPVEEQSLKLENSLVVVGTLSKAERPVVLKFLKTLNVPIFLEVSSGIKRLGKPLESQIVGGEKIVSQMLKSGDVKSLLRIGDVPLGRYWRDLDLLEIPTFSVSAKNFKGTERSKLFYGPIQDFNFNLFQLPEWDYQPWVDSGNKRQEDIFDLIDKYPLSEAAFVKKVLVKAESTDSLYIGNSLPIRLVDLVGESVVELSGNRGANGIDGQISSALGWFGSQSKNTMLIGDLTTLYDSNGFWVTSYLEKNEISVNSFVINNKGGKIFSRIFEEKLFQNQHNIEFSYLAKLWGWNYQRLRDDSHWNFDEGLNLIECCPCPTQDKNFWQEYDSLWK